MRTAQWTLYHPNVRPAPNLLYHDDIKLEEDGSRRIHNDKSCDARPEASKLIGLV